MPTGAACGAAGISHNPNTITIASPFPDELLPLAWSWINEFPDRNLDDLSPANLDEFIAEMQNRHSAGELTWCIFKDSQPCGIVGYKPWTPHNGVFHGICFTQSAWGRSTTATAIKMILNELFKSGINKVSAFFFADNIKINNFLRALGATQEGYLSKQALRNGTFIDMIVLAIFKETLCR